MTLMLLQEQCQLTQLAMLVLSYCAEDIRTVQNLLCQIYAQQNKLDSLLCTAILGCSDGPSAFSLG